MELLKEAKGGNREAFDKLLEEYRHIFYKTARIYFREDYSAIKGFFPEIDWKWVRKQLQTF